VKEYVELHNGYIDLESELGLGSTFKVFLPLGNSHLSPDQIVDGSEESFFKDQPDPGLERNVKNAIARPLGSTPKILVVEDNDELRNYIIESLYMDFDVYEAADGEEGFRLANEILPELIVSDVMMPKMTGFELCTAIRQNLITSHIPLILLTVLESSEDRIEGFEEGADDYLNKPFEMDVLTARIHNLIKSRNLLRSKYANEVNAELNNITRNSTDRSFVSKATSILADNLSNIDFTAEEFSREIGMSRSNLHLKIKALTNQSTTEFIRTYRLKEAGKLLRTNDYNISEVAYQVGFNKISYFNRCFKKLYNITPSQFLEEISQHRS